MDKEYKMLINLLTVLKENKRDYYRNYFKKNIVTLKNRENVSSL